MVVIGETQSARGEARGQLSQTCIDPDLLAAIREVAEQQRVVSGRRYELQTEIRALREAASADLHELRYTEWPSKRVELQERAQRQQEKATALEPQLAEARATEAELEKREKELREQLQTMGYLHLRGVFAADEMARANAEIDRLAALARPGDNESWFAQDADGADVVCRLVYASQRSEVLAALDADPRVRRLGTLLDSDARIAADRMEGSAVLLKVPGPTKGLSNIPWHQDCGMGGHGLICPAVSVGIQITGSSAAQNRRY